jgi:hypothetical protein
MQVPVSMPEIEVHARGENREDYELETIFLGLLA